MAMMANRRWLNALEFLWCCEDIRPATPKFDPGSTDELELRRCKPTVHVYSTATDDKKPPLDRLLERYPSCYKLKRAVCWLSRFVCIQSHKSPARTGRLTVDEMMDAERKIFAYVQRDAFGSVSTFLQGKTSDVKLSSLICGPVRRLSSILGSYGLIRVGGRLRDAPIDYSAKHPVLVPTNNHVTDVIIMSHHLAEGNADRDHVLISLRQSVWNVSGKSAVRRVIDRCPNCKRMNQPPCKQLMADVPQDRLTSDDLPFSSVGVDFLGHSL